MKLWYTSKTVWFFGLFLLINVAGLFGFVDWQPTPEQAEWVGSIVALIGLILRWKTSQQITFKR